MRDGVVSLEYDNRKECYSVYFFDTENFSSGWMLEDDLVKSFYTKDYPSPDDAYLEALKCFRSTERKEFYVPND